MVGRREAQGMVDRFQKLACLEAVKRRQNVTIEDVQRFAALPMADVRRYLDALKQDGKIIEKIGRYSAR
ncbi:MAG: hypothetical protein AAF830_10370 [Pseudomonadota bacterium]